MPDYWDTGLLVSMSVGLDGRPFLCLTECRSNRSALVTVRIFGRQSNPVFFPEGTCLPVFCAVYLHSRSSFYFAGAIIDSLLSRRLTGYQ